jgi:hypothetical protein
MATRRKPWPEGAADEYHEMLRATQALVRMSELALKECFSSPYDMPLLAELIPRIQGEWSAVRLSCLRAQAQRQEGERWPRWVLYALEDIIAVAVELEGLAKSMDTLLKLQHWPTLKQYMSESMEAARKAEELLLGGPPPEETSVIDEALEVIKNYDDKNPPQREVK